MRSAGRELLDGPVTSLRELEANFNDIETANRLLGGVRAARDAVFAFSPKTLVDVGTGSADIPRALMREARSRGLELSITCVDRNPDVLAIAQERAYAHAELAFVRSEGETLPFPDASFDIAMCNLTLHHCDPAQAVALLKELRRVSRLAPVVTDLRRSRVAWLLAWVLARIFSRNRLTRHDAPLSVLRAYTPGEALDLARRAGWRNPFIHCSRFYRMVLADAV